MINKSIIVLGIIGLLLYTFPAKAITTIVCVGNSVTMTTQYPEALGVKLGPTYRVYNKGIGGSGVTGWSKTYVLQPETQTIINAKPQIITIKMGCNDSHAPDEVLKTDFVPGYNKLIDTFLTISPKPKIFLILPAPMYPPEQADWCRRMGEIIVPLTRNLATTRGLTCVDFYTPLLGHPEYFPNSVHASAGSPPADTMTNVLYRAIKAYATNSLYQAPELKISGVGISRNSHGLSVMVPERCAWKLSIYDLSGTTVAGYSGFGSTGDIFSNERLGTTLFIARLQSASGTVVIPLP